MFCLIPCFSNKMWVTGLLQTWLKLSLHNIMWNTVFGVILDRLWWRRNEWVFRNKLRDTNAVVMNVKSFLCDWNNNKKLQQNLTPDYINVSIEEAERWKRPLEGFAKVNCDGALHHIAAIASCGAVLHNDDGVFMQAYSRRLGHCSILEVELWAIFHGLNMVGNY